MEFIEDTEAVQKLGKLSKILPLAHQELVVSAQAEILQLPRAELMHQSMKNWDTEKQCMLRRLCNLIMCLLRSVCKSSKACVTSQAKSMENTITAN